VRRAAILFAFGLLAVGPAGASPQAARHPIVFVSNWAPHFRTSELYVVHARGGRSRNLTNNELDDVDPSWSPDGKQVVFASRRRGSFDLYLMNARGGSVRRLLALRGDQREPVWSPDGKLIAFVSPDRRRNEKGWRPPQLFVMTAEGTGITQVTHGDNGAEDPAWSPNGTELAGSDGYIFTVSLDGSDFRELQPAVEAEFDAHPSWSPDGKRIAFDRGELDFSTTDIWVMDADGSGQRRLARFGAQPSWSPDGRTIAFVNGDVWECDRDGCWEDGLSAIATIRASGGRRHYVTRPLPRLGESFGAPARFLFGDGATFFGVHWSRDGRELLYARRLDERTLDLFGLTPGERQKQLTHTRGTETTPVASPDGRRVMFARYNGPEVFVIDVGRRAVHRLATQGYVGSWSPDGRRLAYVVASGRQPPRIYTADSDGSHPRRLVNGIDPTWSPDGRRIAFVQLSHRNSYVGHALGVIDAGGGVARPLLSLRRRSLYGLAWSPAGNWIAFVNSHPTKLASFIELVNAETGATRRVTSGRFWDGIPVWSPDGRRLAFDRRLSGSSDLVAVVVCRWDGRGAHRLGKWRWREFGPSWSPTGRRLVLASRRDGNYEITTVRPDGTGRRALTHNLADNIEPSW
jgi:TolB protein